MSNSALSRHPSSVKLHQLHLRALPPAEAQEVQAHVGGCPRCGQDLEALAADHLRFEREVLPRTRDAVARRDVPAARPGRRWLFPVFGVLGAAAVLLLAGPALHLRGGSDAPIIHIQPKGGIPLTIVAQHEGQVVTVDDGKTQLRAGDRMRFVVRPGPARFVLIASIDGGGHATLYHPFGGTESAALAPGAEVELPGSIALDTSPGPERVFVFLSARPLAAAPIMAELARLAAQGPAAVRTATPLSLDGIDTQASVLFEKSR